MKKLLLPFTLSLSFAISVSAQTENTAPVVWERYRHSDLEVSVNLPKMPTVIENYDSCREDLKRSSWAYAESAVYELTVYARVAPKTRPTHCSTTRMVFDQSTIDSRLEQLRLPKDVVETKTRAADLDAYQFKDEKSVRLIVPDIVHQRWIELVITHYPKETPDTDRFFASLQFDAAAGKEIGEGSKVTLGDPVSEAPSTETPAAPATIAKPGALSSSDPVKASGSGSGPGDGNGPGSSARKEPPAPSYVILAKPHARYTDAARKANENGSVRLKVTLAANGAVDTITAVTELKYGLTEQAINAARRLVFLPKRVNEKPVNAVLTMEYTFSIY